MKYKIAWKSEVDGKTEYGDIEYSSLEQVTEVIEYLRDKHNLFAWIVTIKEDEE